MKLDNDTPYAARMFRGEPEPDIMLGTVLVQVAYRVGERGEMTLCPADRTWGQEGVASRPKPFTKMPLVYERAYGGLAHYRESQVAFPDYPEGRGDVCEAEAAVGTAVPNVEDPNARIQSWRDQPPPRGWAPLPPQTGLHLRRSVQVLDLKNYMYRFTQHAFSCAHPDLTLAALEPGTPGMLSGVTLPASSGSRCRGCRSRSTSSSETKRSSWSPASIPWPYVVGRIFRTSAVRGPYEAWALRMADRLYPRLGPLVARIGFGRFTIGLFNYAVIERVIRKIGTTVTTKVLSPAIGSVVSDPLTNLSRSIGEALADEPPPPRPAQPTDGLVDSVPMLESLPHDVV